MHIDSCTSLRSLLLSLKVPYMSWNYPFVRYLMSKCFFQFVECNFILVIISFEMWKSLNLMNLHLFIFGFVCFCLTSGIDPLEMSLELLLSSAYVLTDIAMNSELI